MRLTKFTQKIICIIIYCSTLYGSEATEFPAGIAQHVSRCPDILVPVHIPSDSYQLSDAVLRGVIWDGADQPRYLIYEQFGKARRDILFYAIQALGGLAATVSLAKAIEHTWQRTNVYYINAVLLIYSSAFTVACSGLALLQGITSVKIATTRKHDDPSIDPVEDDVLLSDSDSLHLKRALGLSDRFIRRTLYCKKIIQDTPYHHRCKGAIYYVPLFQVADKAHAIFAKQQELVNTIHAIQNRAELNVWCRNFSNNVGPRLQVEFSTLCFKPLACLEPHYTQHAWEAINDPHGYWYRSPRARDTHETNNYRVPTTHGKILVSPKLRNALHSMLTRCGLRYTEQCTFVSLDSLNAYATGNIQPFTGRSQTLE